MPKTGHYGWTNYATGNIALRVANDEKLHEMMVREWLTESDQDATGAALLARRLFPDGTTPAGVSISDPDVDWAEIADAWNADCGLD